MARGKKTRDEDIDATIESKILDPQKSLRDIQKETGVNYETARNILNDIPEVMTSCDKWERIIETMDWIISDIAEITRLSITTIKTKVNDWTLSINDLKGLNEIAKNNFDRKQILTGKATVNVNVLSDVLKEIQGIE